MPQAMANLVRVFEAMGSVKIINRTDDFIHVTFTSRIFRFVDDVECVFDDRAKVIHIRSASRVGRSDLGANRKRVAAIRGRFNELNSR